MCDGTGLSGTRHHKNIYHFFVKYMENKHSTQGTFEEFLMTYDNFRKKAKKKTDFAKKQKWQTNEADELVFPKIAKKKRNASVDLFSSRSQLKFSEPTILDCDWCWAIFM